MRPGLLLAAGILAGCASGRPQPVRAPEPPAAPPTTERDREIVALFNGEPLTRRMIADTLLELDLKSAVDQYVRWRLVEDRRTALGISHSPDELRRRAEAYARTMRMQKGEEAFRADLARESTTEEAWVARLSGSRFLNEMLTLDKILRYNSLLEDTLEIDRLVFVEEGDAAKFVAAAREKGFEKAAEEAEKPAQGRATAARFPREVFPKGWPPSDPALDSWIVDALLALKPGEFTGVEHSRTGYQYVARLRNLRKGRAVSYEEVKGEVFEGILKDPPSPLEYRRWVDRETSKCRIEYGDGKGSPRGR